MVFPSWSHFAIPSGCFDVGASMTPPGPHVVSLVVSLARQKVWVVPGDKLPLNVGNGEIWGMIYDNL